MDLDAYQRDAVSSTEKYLQVIGHPGTGKTLVIASRIAQLIEGGVDPSSIVALTFTNSARRSLRNKIADLLGAHSDAANNIYINTYHSFCVDLISQYPEDVGLTSDWKIVDILDQYNVLSEPAMHMDGKKIGTFPVGFSREERERYRRRLAEDKTYDFSQALLFGERIIRQRNLGIKHLLIDEFQDCDTGQWAIVTSLVRSISDPSVFVVGDPNQEIFNFKNDHLTDAFGVMRAALPGVVVRTLRYNYRSTPEIIEAFQGILPSVGPYAPNLIAKHASGAEPELQIYASAEEEAAGVAHLVSCLARHYDLNDIAVLTRWNSQAQDMVRALAAANIPTVSSTNLRALATRARTNLAMSLLKWSSDPRDFYLLQVLNNRYFKYLPDDEREHLDRQSGQQSMVDAILARNKDIQHLFLTDWLPNVREKLVSSNSAQHVADIVVSSLAEWGRASGHRFRFHPSKLEQEQWHYFLDSIASTEVAEPEAGGHVLRAVLKHLYHQEDLRSDVGSANAVNVRTIHSAKSKEWAAVIMPSGRSVPYLSRDSVSPSERRLFYVGASRARSQLYFTNAGPLSVRDRNSFLHINAKADSSPLRGPEAVARYPTLFKPLTTTRLFQRIKTI